MKYFCYIPVLKMEEGTQAKKCRQPLEAEKGKKTNYSPKFLRKNTEC